MRIFASFILTAFSFALARAGHVFPKSPVAAAEAGLAARGVVSIEGRGLSGSTCTYGDPLHDSSTWEYEEFCTDPTDCEEGDHGFYADGFCNGGSNNKCCIVSRCAAPYGDYLCFDTDYWDCGGEYITGYCPGPNNYKCCV